MRSGVVPLLLHLTPLVRITRLMLADLQALLPSSRERHCKRRGHDRLFDAAGWFCKNCPATGPRAYRHGQQP